ncbi:DUF6286 domain-containing protein [Actinomadura decatromicini]|uniref:Alkaline shock response membrane anchor protein AmaP n=1 Tax=Actinomadura decatromicini TaxID=2604572 RepID=A0A5D3FY41_9ACTN|nr:DUF6286 domain-containing protein [Actinomadura decatromicini]TYK52942.1 alkaline shock response membrane anchor protein AmaP [Actinomadura decatromicini]
MAETTLVQDVLGQDEITRDAVERERAARRLAVREFRPPRPLAGIAAALLVTAAGGTAAVELLAAALGSGVHPLPGAAAVTEALRHRSWNDPAVLAGAGAALALGLAFLLAALPGRPRGVPLDGADPRLAGGLGRADLRRTLADAALAVPGIERVRVRARRWGRGTFRRGLVVRATTYYRNPANLDDLVRDAVDERLDRVEPMHRPRVDVRLGWRKD